MPSPADWDARYLASDIPWDLGGASPLIQRLASEHVEADAQIVIPGCGLAHDVEALAQQGHHVLGLDISPTAVTQANARLRAAELSNAQVILGDFLDNKALPLEGFDVLIEHTCYCAIEPHQRSLYVASASTCLKEGGLLIGAFLDFEGGGPPYGTSQRALRAGFSSDFDILEITAAPEPFGPKDVTQMAAVFRKRARR